ncbi:hypothetical protein ONS95_010077 [Cadophora gregata]|uniref:uncharacterized protein n=1 Tax=Cadophora gregata TaxID=51156 RepID=UPI0026DBB9E8|nr:uncharacterized protein ONS95_010077 [Cadophora gregata]KAK0121794.1 hypothetical protein ONS95_010077 [Cadophora gregata]
MKDPRVSFQRANRETPVPLHACHSSRQWALEYHYISIPCHFDGSIQGAIYVNWKLDDVIVRDTETLLHLSGITDLNLTSNLAQSVSYMWRRPNISPSRFRERTNDTGVRDVPFPAHLNDAEEKLQNLSVAEILNPINRAALARFKNLKTLHMHFGGVCNVPGFKSHATLERALVQLWNERGIEAPERIFLRPRQFEEVIVRPTLRKFIHLNQLQVWTTL